MKILRYSVAMALLAVGPLPAFGAPKPPVEIPAPTVALSAPSVVSSRPILKRRVAITRFSNSTRYGKALLLDTEQDPLAHQASDILTSRLVESGKFMVFERDDLGVLEREQLAAGAATGKLVGVDALIVGSVTEFGRRVEGKSGFLNSKMKQVADATVEVRLVDVRTGRAFFSTSGHGSASVEVGEVAGFGSKAGYDSTLNDQAIAAAISDLTNNVMQKLQERRWFTDVLQVRGADILISGGSEQGLKVGDRLRVETRGEVITSGQTGLPIQLPGQEVATIELASFFGDDPSAQGAIAHVVEGKIPSGDPKALMVVEASR